MMTRCIFWLGTRSDKGYGRFKFQGRIYQAHRYVYEFFIGPIPEGKEIHHLCGQPPCVNEEHLVAVTRREHMHMDPRRHREHDSNVPCRNGHLAWVRRPSTWACRECERAAGVRYRERKKVANYGNQ